VEASRAGRLECGHMKFSIRDVLFLTVIAALGLCWALEMRRANHLAIQTKAAVKEAESSLALSEALTQQLKNKNPAASIEINVNGSSSTTSTRYGGPQAPAANLPLP
jgi:hypothetical protein